MGRDQHQWDKPQPFHKYRYGQLLVGLVLAVLFHSKSWGGGGLFTMIATSGVSWGSRKNIY